VYKAVGTGWVRKTVFSVKVCHHLSCLHFQVLVHWTLFSCRNYPYPTPNSAVLASCKQIVHPNLTNPNKRGRAPPCKNKNAGLWSALCVCLCVCVLCPCACVPFYRSKFCLTETILYMSSIMTPVVFRGLISNMSEARGSDPVCPGHAVLYPSTSTPVHTHSLLKFGLQIHCFHPLFPSTVWPMVCTSHPSRPLSLNLRPRHSRFAGSTLT
jgi:hypothetical protein